MKKSDSLQSKSKNSTSKKNFYLPILDCLKESTNLSKITQKLSISKQQLNYYLRELKRRGLVYNKGNGWWELTEKGKNSTQYGNFYPKDSIRGHAYVWNVEKSKEIKDWDKRIEILEKNGINYVLVGALRNIPRIKILGRKIWLCNDHFRVFDIEKSSYYGKDAKEARNNSSLQVLRIIQGLESKLGISLKPYRYGVMKEHYALIKNDLAIDQNNKGIIMRIKDENNEEFLLIDDSLEQGGELENVGKKAYKTNIPMQKWWIANKNDNFETTKPENIKKIIKGHSELQKEIESLKGELLENQRDALKSDREISASSMDLRLVIKQLESNLRGVTELVYLQQQEINNLKEK
jgi:predicted transcriptional regulator